MKAVKKKFPKRSCERLSETNNFKMKKIFSLLLFISAVTQANALIISEVMSNPTGVDDGREWIEIFNNTANSVDLSAMTISIKGATAIAVTPLSGGTNLTPGGYAIIGSIVSGSTKFLQDYPTYNGPLFKSGIGLVNTGVTSIDIKLSGSIVDSLSSYTAAKDSFTLSLVSGSFVSSNPTPGAENQAVTSSDSGNNATSTNTQQTIQAQSAPSPDIVLYMPFEKTVVAGADSNFTTYGMTRGGNNIEGLTFSWSYGDGGQGEGTTTLYRYVYPGRYLAKVEAGNGHVLGNASMKIRVVSPDIAITKVDTGKYGLYVDIYNPNNYDLDLSQWKLSFDGKAFPFPKNTIILGGETTHFSGIAMGFASTTINQNSVVKILFPNLEEVVSYTLPNSLNQNLIGIVAGVATSTILIPSNQLSEKLPSSTSTKILNKLITNKIITKQYLSNQNLGTSSLKTSSSSATLLTNQSSKPKDTRLITWFKSLFKF